MKYDHSSIFILPNSSFALWRNEVDGTKERKHEYFIEVVLWTSEK